MFKFIKKHKLASMFTLFAVASIGIIVSLYNVDRALNNKIVTYITSFGWQINERPEITHMTIPEKFDSIYQTYNFLQAESGFNLEKYRGCKTTRYTYKVTNHKFSEQTRVSANIIVYQGEIVAADISSNAIDGFMQQISKVEDIVSNSNP